MTMPKLSPRSRLLLYFLLVLASAEFVVRGPWRFYRASDFNDLISPYIQSRALVKGLDPYSPEVLVRLWPQESAEHLEFLKKDLANGTLISERGVPTAYPLSCLLLLAPLAVLPWPVAHIVWLMIALGLSLEAISLLLEWAGFGKDDWRMYVFVAFALALAPLHTGFAAGSIVISTVAICGIAFVREQYNKNGVGILLGIAVCLKPQIGLPFLLCYLLRRRWRAFAVASGIVVTASLLAMLRLAISGTSWLESYRATNRGLLATAMLSDFTERDPIRFLMIDLRVLIYALLHNAAVTNLLALVVSALLFAAWLALVLRYGLLAQSGDAAILLPVSALAVMSLLPVYHRLYDAFLLIFPICWSLLEFYGPQQKLARTALIAMLPFLVPGGAILMQLEMSGRIPVAIAQAWWWNAFVMPHEIWLLLALSVMLLWGMARAGTNPAVSQHN
jgi:hypothetical protein